MKRRAFLGWLGVGTLAPQLPGIAVPITPLTGATVGRGSLEDVIWDINPTTHWIVDRV